MRMMKDALKIEDLVFPQPSKYSEKCSGNSMTIHATLQTHDAKELHKMARSEGWFLVSPIGDEKSRKMRVSHFAKAANQNDIYDIELTEALKEYPYPKEEMQTLREIRSLLRTMPHQANLWFLVISAMLTGTFIVGIGLIITSIVTAYLGSNLLVSAVFAGTGGASIITSFVTIPPLQLQKSRIDFSQWVIAFYCWAEAHLNTYEFFYKKEHIAKTPFHEFKEINDYLFDLRERTLKSMEEICETSPPSLSLRKKTEK